MVALKLRLLGEFNLEGANSRHLPTRKAEALLAYLASPAGRSHGRDKLAALLWGNKEEDKAHHNLAQALHLIRRTLGANGAVPLIADSRTVTLIPSQIDIDVAAFEVLVAQQTAKAYTEATELYQGDFLDGIDIRETAFEDWLRGERGRLRKAALDALEGLLRYQVEADDNPAAIDTANRLLSLDPFNEPVHRTTMHLYCRAGRRDAAIRQYLSCAETLKRELDIEPDAKTRALHEDILSERTSPPRRLRPLGGLPSDVSLPDKPSLAVLPFENILDDPGQEFFAEGIAEDVITALSRFRSLFVIARGSSFTYKGHAGKIARVARELGVRYVVEGSVRRADNRVRITAQLIDAVNGTHLWAKRFDGGLDDVFDLQDRITEQIVIAVEPEIGARERERAKCKPPGSLDAWECLQRGLSHFYRANKTDFVEAVQFFREAVALYPEFAAAHAYLAFAIQKSVPFGYAEDTAKSVALARAAAERAASLDPNEPMAHFILGRTHISAGEIGMAIGEMQTAIALNPNFAWGHFGLGHTYHYGAGQWEQALPHYNAALRLSPRDPMRWYPLMMKGSALRALRRHDEAIAHCRRACQVPDSGFLPYMNLAASLAESGQICQARVVVEKAIQLQPALSIRYCRSHFVGIHKTESKDLFESLRKAGVPE